ncbi:MAG: TraX family protein [Oscillospiraceae bacterium]|nr:TraX family protein [Oscillospiraceae bacterium]MDD4369166.1 TraX family protein [Oscillospiraceae bacterium]
MEKDWPLQAADRDFSAQTLKVLAIVAMTMDHVGLAFAFVLPFSARAFLIAPGGMTFPVMACLLGEGYRHTRSVRRYMLRLLFCALLAQPAFQGLFGSRLNILFTLALGLLLLYLNERLSTRRGLFWLSFAAAVVLSYFCDWGVIGIPMIYFYDQLRRRPGRAWLPLLLPLLYFIITPGLLYGLAYLSSPENLPQLLYALVGCTGSGLCLTRYRGRRGGGPGRWFFYFYYPAHLSLIWLLQTLFRV